MRVRTGLNPAVLDELQDRLYDIAENIGWHQITRGICEDLILLHGEISEAWAEHHDDHGLTEIYQRNGKREGVPVEAADIGIRLLAITKQYDIRMSTLIVSLLPVFDEPESFDVVTGRWHRRVSRAMEAWRNGLGITEMPAPDQGVMGHLAGLWLDLESWCDQIGIDLIEQIEIKTVYNKTRPYRHGDKRI